MNRLVLRAQVVERCALRWTPAGLPALDLVLKHESEATEAGMPRKVSLEIRAVAVGEIAQPIAAAAVGTTAEFDGFLATRRNGRGIVYHVTAFTPSHPD